MARCSTSWSLALYFIATHWVADAPASAAEFYAIVERNGTVALCLSNGAILFPDRCAGNGRLTIVEPIKEGTVVWRSAIGTVSLENEAPNNPQCALGHAKWDSKAEKVVSTGRKITKTDRIVFLKRLNKSLPEGAQIIEDDVTAFALDLDDDGRQEIVFVASNLTRVADQWGETRQRILI
jgi:hypothetical protein